ncbi:MAG: RNA polymerase sigma factor SigJ [Alphaproteobacteria bacterium]
MSEQEFEARRPSLLGLAYRMLGSRADAEDAVQDAWLRWREKADGVDNPRAWLTTVVTRLCLDRLKSAQRQREVYVGPWLPEPVADAGAFTPEAASELADDLSFALLLALERLTPLERAAFLLHDVFDASWAEVSDALGRSEAACRRLASRARRAVRERRRTPAPPERHARLLGGFLAAVEQGDVAGLTRLLTEDVVALTDGGGRKAAALNPIRGPDRVARFFVSLARKYRTAGIVLQAEQVTLNGVPAFLLYADGKLDQAVTLEVRGPHIAAIYVVRNPDKLSRLMH